jgi:hypothetical protein
MLGDHDRQRRFPLASYHIGQLTGLCDSGLRQFRFLLPTKIIEAVKSQSLTFCVWLRSMTDDRSARSNDWDIIFPTSWFHLYWTAPAHLPSDPMIHISLDLTVEIAPKFERDGHDPSIPYKRVSNVLASMRTLQCHFYRDSRFQGHNWSQPHNKLGFATLFLP